jgi:hypothetical protein
MLKRPEPGIGRLDRRSRLRLTSRGGVPRQIISDDPKVGIT